MASHHNTTSVLRGPNHFFQRGWQREQETELVSRGGERQGRGPAQSKRSALVNTLCCRKSAFGRRGPTHTSLCAKSIPYVQITQWCIKVKQPTSKSTLTAQAILLIAVVSAVVVPVTLVGGRYASSVVAREGGGGARWVGCEKKTHRCHKTHKFKGGNDDRSAVWFHAQDAHQNLKIKLKRGGLVREDPFAFASIGPQCRKVKAIVGMLSTHRFDKNMER